jgi:hypothetical protein
LHRRGLRKGDPLSPLLFVIASDILAVFLMLADHRGTLKRNQFLQPKNRVSMYANDVVIFIEPVLEDVTAIKALLDCFGEASGLHTNYSKSSIIPIHCQAIDVTPLAGAL